MTKGLNLGNSAMLGFSDVSNPQHVPADFGRLPDYIEPMLAQPSVEPFDSADYLFEIKWDGTRAMVYIENGGVRLMNRRKRNISDRYPDLQCLSAAPAGTLLDGEIVVIRNGKSDFQALQKREQSRTEFRIRNLAKVLPATFIVFDQLFDRFHPILDRSCIDRREIARQTVAALKSPNVIMSEGVVGEGVSYFQRAMDQDLEGIMAKRIESGYYPGRRTDAWIKIKRQQEVPCVIVGYLTGDRGELRSLVIASQIDGQLCHVGQVGSGLTQALSEQLLARLKMIGCEKPVVQCSVRGHWVEPQVYCLVRCMEKTRDGHLRAPVWVKLL